MYYANSMFMPYGGYPYPPQQHMPPVPSMVGPVQGAAEVQGEGDANAEDKRPQQQPSQQTEQQQQASHIGAGQNQNQAQDQWHANGHMPPSNFWSYDQFQPHPLAYGYYNPGMFVNPYYSQFYSPHNHPMQQQEYVRVGEIRSRADITDKEGPEIIEIEDPDFYEADPWPVRTECPIIII